MKTITAILILISLCAQAQLTNVNVGAYYNDPKADNPRTAFQKINANFNWLKTNYTGVGSVQGKNGTVRLTSGDIPEGTNLYWTATRFNGAIASSGVITPSQLASSNYVTSTELGMFGDVLATTSTNYTTNTITLTNLLIVSAADNTNLIGTYTWNGSGAWVSSSNYTISGPPGSWPTIRNGFTPLYMGWGTDVLSSVWEQYPDFGFIGPGKPLNEVFATAVSNYIGQVALQLFNPGNVLITNGQYVLVMPFSYSLGPDPFGYPHGEGEYLATVLGTNLIALQGSVFPSGASATNATPHGVYVRDYLTNTLSITMAYGNTNVITTNYQYVLSVGQVDGSNIVSGTIAPARLPGVTTNYAVPGGLTFYITNGLIMKVQ